MHAHPNATFSPNLNDGENHWLQHMTMWGSNGYPVRKVGSRWYFERFYGVGGAPVADRTKKVATVRCEAFYSILRDKKAGRLPPSPDSPAALNAAENM